MAIDLRQMQIFCDLVDSGSFSQTAERHFVSQSAVSQSLRALESELGQELLDRGRGKGRATPTQVGEMLYEGALPILRAAEDLEERIRGLADEVAGIMRVATVYSVGLHALPPRLKPFLARYPRVNVHLEYSRTSKVYQDVLSRAVDVGIVACPTEHPGIEIHPFGDERMVLICTPEHPLASRGSISLTEIDGQPFIGFSDDIPTRKLIDDQLKRHGVRVRVIHAFDNIETIKNLVEIGSGVALVPDDTALQEVRTGQLAIVALDPGSAFRRPAGMLVRRATSLRAAVRAFLESMRPDSARRTPESQ